MSAPTEETVDVLIIGAGPGGTSAAITLAHQHPEWTIVLLDKATFPRDKICGDGLSPEAASLLVELGAGDVLTTARAVHGISLSAPGGLTFTTRVSDPGYVVPRRVLDAALVREAERAGVHVLREHAEKLRRVEGAVMINETWRARHIIAADGANSRVRRELSLGGATGRNLSFGIRAYAPDHYGDLRIGWDAEIDGGYWWSFPLGDGTANVGLGGVKQHMPNLSDARATMENRLGFDLAGATLRGHHLPLSTAGLCAAVPGVLFVGDAAGLINPLSGEGIFYALVSGQLAGRALGASQPEAVYRRGLARRLGAHRASSAIAYRWMSPRWIDAAIAAGERHPRAFSDLRGLTLGTGRLTPRLLGMMAYERFRAR